MGILVKLLGSGMGLASEAIHSARSRSPGAPSGPPSATTPQPAVRGPTNDVPPGYAELPDEATAEMFIRAGKGERLLDLNETRLARGGQDLELTVLAAEDADCCFAADEAAWELDEMAESVAPPLYDEFETSAAPIAENDSEEVKIKKQEAMVRDIVALAGPPVPHRIPCPVIIPQRRPRSIVRGFVRANAPVLQECGHSAGRLPQVSKGLVSIKQGLANPYSHSVVIVTPLIVPSDRSVLEGLADPRACRPIPGLMSCLLPPKSQDGLRWSPSRLS